MNQEGLSTEEQGGEVAQAEGAVAEIRSQQSRFLPRISGNARKSLLIALPAAALFFGGCSSRSMKNSTEGIVDTVSEKASAAWTATKNVSLQDVKGVAVSAKDTTLKYGGKAVSGVGGGLKYVWDGASGKIGRYYNEATGKYVLPTEGASDEQIKLVDEFNAAGDHVKLLRSNLEQAQKDTEKLTAKADDATSRAAKLQQANAKNTNAADKIKGGVDEKLELSQAKEYANQAAVGAEEVKRLETEVKTAEKDLETIAKQLETVLK